MPARAQKPHARRRGSRSATADTTLAAAATFQAPAGSSSTSYMHTLRVPPQTIWRSVPSHLHAKSATSRKRVPTAQQREALRTMGALQFGGSGDVGTLLSARARWSRWADQELWNNVVERLRGEEGDDSHLEGSTLRKVLLERDVASYPRPDATDVAIAEAVPLRAYRWPILPDDVPIPAWTLSEEVQAIAERIWRSGEGAAVRSEHSEEDLDDPALDPIPADVRNGLQADVASFTDQLLAALASEQPEPLIQPGTGIGTAARAEFTAKSKGKRKETQSDTLRDRTPASRDEELGETLSSPGTSLRNSALPSKRPRLEVAEEARDGEEQGEEDTSSEDCGDPQSADEASSSSSSENIDSDPTEESPAIPLKRVRRRRRRFEAVPLRTLDWRDVLCALHTLSNPSSSSSASSSIASPVRSPAFSTALRRTHSRLRSLYGEAPLDVVRLESLRAAMLPGRWSKRATARIRTGQEMYLDEGELRQWEAALSADEIGPYPPGYAPDPPG